MKLRKNFDVALKHVFMGNEFDVVQFRIFISNGLRNKLIGLFCCVNVD